MDLYEIVTEDPELGNSGIMTIVYINTSIVFVTLLMLFLGTI